MTTTVARGTTEKNGLPTCTLSVSDVFQKRVLERKSYTHTFVKAQLVEVMISTLEKEFII